MRERIRMAASVALLLLITGCGAGQPMGSPREAQPHDPNARMRTDLLRVEPATPAAGEDVRLHFPEGTDRGVAHVLEKRVGEGWELRYYLTAAPLMATTKAGPRWGPADEDYDWVDVGISGPGPDVVRIPDTAEPGPYRICTANAGENFCAEVDIVEG